MRSLDDLDLLPNLREVTFVEDGVLAVPDVFAARLDTDRVPAVRPEYAPSPPR